MDLHILTMLPLLGLTTSWRGVRIGGKIIGGVGGLGGSSNPAVQAFDKAKAAGDREGMEKAARQLNEQRMEQNRASASKPISAQTRQPKTDAQRLAQSDRIVETARRRISNLEDRISGVQDRIRVAEQARREGMQLVQTKQVKQRKQDGIVIPKTLRDEYDPVLRVSRRKANASQIAKIDDTINQLYEEMARLSNRRDQVLGSAQRASKVRGDIEFAQRNRRM